MDATFVAKGSNRYSLQVTPETKGFEGNQIVTLPARVVSFDGGIFKTDRDELAEAIRATDAFRHGKIFEMEQGEAPPKPAPTPVVRGAVSSKVVHKEAGVKEAQDKKLSLQAKGQTKCDECQKSFTEDYQGFKLRGHMISHRRKK